MKLHTLQKRLKSLGGIIGALLLAVQLIAPGHASAATGSFELSSATYSVNEEAGEVKVLLQRVGGSSGAATVQIRTLADTADWKTDYNSFSWTTVSFADGETQKSISIGIVDDTDQENDETLNVLLRKPSDGTTLGSIDKAVVTIIDDDSNPGSFQFGAASYKVDEGAGKIDVQLQRVDGSAGAATVDVRTLGVDADYATDYDSFSWTTVSFAAGQTTQTVSVGITDDAEYEGDESLKVLIQNPTGGATLGAVTEALVTIVDNDEAPDTAAPTVTITSPSSGSEVTSEKTVTIVASATDNVGVSKVEFYVDGTLLGSDTTNTYSAALPVTSDNNGTCTLTAIAYDAEGNSTQSASVSMVVNIPVASTDPGSFQLASASYKVDEGAGQASVVLQRVNGSAGAATVEVRTLGVTADYATDYDSFSWTVVNFADGQTSKTLNVGITDDSAVEGDEAFTVLLRNPTGGTTLGTIIESTVTIVDNDTDTTASDSGTTDSGTTDSSASGSSSAVDQNLSYLPVFPGAMGHGTETKAGRGGTVIKVTNLNDSGSGSLRAALEASGPRIIVFEVSGTINLQSQLIVRNPYVTVAGQTAPSPGINIKDGGVTVYAHDVLIQHLRIRVGDDQGSAIDGIQILGPNAYNVVIDHVSAAWAIDENMSTWYELNNVTFSNCIISEGLFHSIHPEGAHSMGLLLGDHAQDITVIGNLFANNNWRLPRLKGDVSAAVVNNLMYNGGDVGSWMSVGSSAGPNIVSAVGNKFIPGPNSRSSFTAISTSSDVTAAGGSKMYFEDNSTTSTEHSSTDAEVSSAPIWHESLVAYGSDQVETKVLASAGARPADRDVVDARIVNEVKTRSGYLIDSQDEVGGWPSLANNKRTFTVPSDPNGDSDGDGYTNIEEILQQMAEAVE